MASSTNLRPLVIFALDGADAGFVDRWSEAGDLPAIASIAKRGRLARVAGPELMSTNGAWLSLFSGISRSEHGFYSDRQLASGSYELTRRSARETGAEPFWSRLAGSAKTVAIIDAFETQPVAGLAGVQLADWAVQQPFDAPGDPPSAEPPSVLEDARRFVGDPLRVEVFEPGGTVGEDAAAYKALLESVEKKGALCRHLLARDRFDLTVISFVEAHTAAHRLWDYRPRGTRHREALETGGEAGELPAAIRNVYRAIDRQIELVLEALPQDSDVFIVSLFGMRDLYPTDDLMRAFCRQLGYEVPTAGVGGVSSVLGWLRRTLGADVRAGIGRLLPERFRLGLQAGHPLTDIDWARTRAFSVSALQTGFIRVNCRGREPRGIVEPGAEYESILNELESDLRALVDVRSGEPAVADVVRTAQAFRCGSAHDLPDLVVEWKTCAYLMDRLRHPRTELVQAKQHYNRSSHHAMTGFVVAAGPSVVAESAVGEVSPLDFAPVFLTLLGERTATRISARALTGLLGS